MAMGDEDVPYRATLRDLPQEAEKQTTADERNYDTLRIVYKQMVGTMETLDQFHAFDLTETELKIKQQIKAHQMAFNILAPLMAQIETAISRVDGNYKE